MRSGEGIAHLGRTKESLSRTVKYMRTLPHRACSSFPKRRRSCRGSSGTISGPYASDSHRAIFSKPCQVRQIALKRGHQSCMASHSLSNVKKAGLCSERTTGHDEPIPLSGIMKASRDDRTRSILDRREINEEIAPYLWRRSTRCDINKEHF